MGRPLGLFPSWLLDILAYSGSVLMHELLEIQEEIFDPADNSVGRCPEAQACHVHRLCELLDWSLGPVSHMAGLEFAGTTPPWRTPARLEVHLA